MKRYALQSLQSIPLHAKLHRYFQFFLWIRNLLYLKWAFSWMAWRVLKMEIRPTLEKFVNLNNCTMLAHGIQGF